MMNLEKVARRTSPLVALALALAWPVLAVAADLPPPSPRPLPAPAATPAPAGPGAFAPPDATCLEWTDGCRTCQKPPSGEIACSNVGLACTAQAPRCTRR
jgi:hypothetical protein